MMDNDTDREIERDLDIRGLRKGFLSHTRKAYGLLPQQERSRVLDIGCGRGEVTLELARLTSGQIIAIDINDAAFRDLQSTIERESLGTRVIFQQSSLFDVTFPDCYFDLLWEEGVLHTLDPARSIPVCDRLLKWGGFLVSAETLDWFEGKLGCFGASGFELVERLLWPKGSWWTDYYEPLEKRISLLREKYGNSRDLSVLSRYDNEIRMVKSDPEKFDCGHFLFHKKD
jgi:SAM-dependent methyltransferase